MRRQRRREKHRKPSSPARENPTITNATTNARFVPETPPENPDENPHDKVITSAVPTTGRYADSQPTSSPPTRIVVRVSDRGVTRRSWPLTVNPRPSGDVLAGPTYWPTTDKAVHRPNSTNVWLEPLEFLYNVALLPYRVIDTPPWSKVIYSPSGGIDWSNVEQSGVIFQERNE